MSWRCPQNRFVHKIAFPPPPPPKKCQFWEFSTDLYNFSIFWTLLGGGEPNFADKNLMDTQTFLTEALTLWGKKESSRDLEAQQRYFSYRAILAAIVSQTSFVLVLKGYRAIIARYVAKWGIAQVCLCETKNQGGASHHFSEDFSLLVAFLLVTFSWLFRGPLLSRKTVFEPFSLLFRCFFRGFFPVLGKFYAYSPWNSLLNFGGVLTSLKKISRDLGYRSDSVAIPRDMGPLSPGNLVSNSPYFEVFHSARVTSQKSQFFWARWRGRNLVIKVTERTQNADFRRKPQVFCADSPVLLEITAFGGRRNRRCSQNTEDFFAENAGNRRFGLCHLRSVTFSSALFFVRGQLHLGDSLRSVLGKWCRMQKGSDGFNFILAGVYPFTPECTKIAHRRSLAIFAADSGIAGNSAVGIKFVPFNRRENRLSLAIFFAKEIAHLGALKIARFCGGSGENRRRNRRESRDFGVYPFTQTNIVSRNSIFGERFCAPCPVHGNPRTDLLRTF